MYCIITIQSLQQATRTLPDIFTCVFPTISYKKGQRVVLTAAFLFEMVHVSPQVECFYLHHLETEHDKQEACLTVKPHAHRPIINPQLWLLE